MVGAMLRRGFLVVLCLGFVACGPAAQGLSGGIRRSPLAGAQVAEHEQLVAEGDAAFAARSDRAQLELAIQKYEAATKLQDDDWKSYEKLSRACYLLADGWLFFEKDDKEQEFLGTFEKGFAAAERGLAALYPEVEKKLGMGVDLKDAAALVTKEGIGLLYWYSTNLGKWGNAQDITVVVRYKERIFNVMNRVLDLDPTYFYGAPHRYFGAFYSIAPPAFGGDVDKSWEHFQESIKIEPNYLATYNLIAEFYAPKKKDGKLFDEMVQKVRDAPMDSIPGLEAEAAVEKRKAELLVLRRDAGDFPFD
jgi:hypothetical protein